MQKLLPVMEMFTEGVGQGKLGCVVVCMSTIFEITKNEMFHDKTFHLVYKFIAQVQATKGNHVVCKCSQLVFAVFI